jgi:tartrate dehydrogenase/decarboxylase/D-malate dehydrogenase
MRHHWIASISVDGIGPEVVAAGVEALDAVAARDGGFQLQVERLDWGSDRYRRTGAPWGLRLPICQGLNQYASVRPTRILPGATSALHGVGPGDLD